MEFYKNSKEIHQAVLKKLKAQYNLISASRLFVAIAFLVVGYCALNADNPNTFIGFMFFCIVVFVLLMNRHVFVQNKKRKAEALVQINQEEMDYLAGRSIPFQDGGTFADYKHPYTHDLDIFGYKSLFHNLNRTQTYKGSEKLAALLSNILPSDAISANQDAIKELAHKPVFRQEIMASGRVKKDNKEVYEKLLNWANSDNNTISGITLIAAFILPIVFCGSVIIYLITGTGVFSDLAGWVFGFNLIFLLSQLKAIKSEMQHTTEIDDIIHHYGLIIEQIEKENFTSARLISLQQQLIASQEGASNHINRLAALFSRLDSVSNVFGALLLNGAMLYHLHALKSLLQWKRNNAASIAGWLDIIAETEALSCFANHYYNNPSFTFPVLNNECKIDFKNLSHPLLRADGRIGNNIRFDTDFMILTGSNMSGKSTFLRSLGVNMVLAGAGAAVCADEATIQPLPVLVSMRLSDSLSDSESYFFAEVKRLKFIMEELKEQRAFVLLDEILRGTNSDDKQTGTIKVIKKMVQLQAVGAIATHDIEVCALAGDYPDRLVNRCFEAQIDNNELYFDYILRDGICRNKSATFLMEKMGVI